MPTRTLASISLIMTVMAMPGPSEDQDRIGAGIANGAIHISAENRESGSNSGQTPSDNGTGTQAPAEKWIELCPNGKSSSNPTCGTVDVVCGDNGGAFQEMTLVPGSTPPEYRPSGSMTCRLLNDPPPGTPGAGPDAVPEFTEADFRRLPIQAATIGAQPGRHTLKGSETNIYADSQPQEFTATLLGHDFRVRAKPLEYRWDYGDGTTLTTSAPGGPVPESRWGEKTVTSHVFTATGDFTVRLTTVFTGEFSVDGGPYQQIAGTAPVPSEPRTLSVWRSEVKQYADDCNVNPQGAGCQ
jgi:hypothetical protein